MGAALADVLEARAEAGQSLGQYCAGVAGHIRSNLADYKKTEELSQQTQQTAKVRHRGRFPARRSSCVTSGCIACWRGGQRCGPGFSPGVAVRAGCRLGGNQQPLWGAGRSDPQVYGDGQRDGPRCRSATGCQRHGLWTQEGQSAALLGGTGLSSPAPAGMAAPPGSPATAGLLGEQG